MKFKVSDNSFGSQSSENCVKFVVEILIHGNLKIRKKKRERKNVNVYTYGNVGVVSEKYQSRYQW